MKRALLSILGALALLAPTGASAQIVSAISIASCGGTTVAPTTGSAYPIYQDTTGKLCTTGTGVAGNTPFNPTEASGTVTTGGAFQTVFSSNSSRTNCFVMNPTSATEPLYVHWTSATATTANSATLGPGSSFTCAGGGVVVTGAIQVTAATTAHAFVANGS
jgi:hypothetical protein